MYFAVVETRPLPEAGNNFFEPFDELVRLHRWLTAKVSGGEAVRLTAKLDPKAKRERPALKTGAAQEKALGHESSAALQE